MRYDAEKGFFLNGKSVKIQGTCNHQDFAGVGIAVPDTLEAWRVAKLKEMGGNGWRMSHNPPTPELLDACDKLGMLVMDENRHLGDSPDNLAEVASMVRRDRNHPSIIHVVYVRTRRTASRARRPARLLFKAMRQTVLDNDPTRMVSSAMNGGWFDPGFRTVEDLMGVNYNTQVYDQFHAQYPTLPLFGSETASTLTTRGEYANDKERVFVSSYNLTEGSWKPIADRPFVAGGFAWTGFDYKGEPTPYGWPDVNSHFGIMDMCGFPKDNYLLLPGRLEARPPRPPLAALELARQGRPARPRGRLLQLRRRRTVPERHQPGPEADAPRTSTWIGPFPTPPARFLPRATTATTVAATDTVTTTGAPAALRLTTDRTTLTADGEDLTPIEVDVLDSQGHVVPTADTRVTFSVRGAGILAGVGNGDPGDHDPDKGTTRKAFNGKCLVLVGATEKPGDIQLTATAPGLPPVRLSLRATRLFGSELLGFSELLGAHREADAPETTPIDAPVVARPIYHDAASQVDVYDVVTDDMIPATWHGPLIAASALPIAAAERDRALRLVKVALSKYPPEFLQTNLKRVYLVGGLGFKGIKAAATNSTSRLYIVAMANNPLYNDQFIENSVHHEFAHLLQRKYRREWSADAWAACNPTDFRYAARSGVEAVLTARASGRVTDDWNLRGFLSEYGASNADEDFATIASKLLLGDNTFWNRVNTFPALKAKVAVAIAFYAKLDNRFTEAFFRSLHMGMAYVEPPSAPSAPTNTARK